MTQSTSNRRRNLALGVGALLIAGVVLGRRSLTGRAAGGEGGCEGPDYRDPKLGTVKQKEVKVEPGQVLAGASAAIEVIKMIRTYVKYGELQITNGMILDKIKAVQASIDQLNAKADIITNGQNKINANIFKSETIAIISAIDNLFSHYVYVKSNNGDLAGFFKDLLAGNPNGYGTLNLGDLDALATLGQEGLPYLADYYGGNGASEAAIVATNDVGAYAASLQLRLSEGFYMLALAKRAQGTDGDFSPQGNAVALNDKRLANLLDTFLGANDRMNQLVVKSSHAAREAAFTDCSEEYCLNCTRWSFSDSQATPPKSTFQSQYGGIGSEKQACIVERTRAFYAASYTAGLATMKSLLAAQPTFTHWSDASDAPDGGGAPTIHVTQAKYGPGDVSPFLQSAMGNRVEASFVVDIKKLGETLPNVAKDFSVTHTCGTSAVTKTSTLSAEANGKSVTLSCMQIDVSDLVGTWEDRSAGGNFDATPGLRAKVTVVDANTVRFARGDGIAFSLSRSSDPTVLDIGKDCIWYNLPGWQTAAITLDAQRRVDSIRFASGTGENYRRAL
ncbi:MAG: hypothetical protein JWP97_6533 [Labilithrix sp.]|nr:hypothetical protein [Labilithrix sp.]